MNCEDIASLLDDGTIFEASPARQTEVDAHLLICESCCHEWRAAHALRAWRESPAPTARPELFAEVMRRATQPDVARVRRKAFWTGTGIGAALAAGIAIAVVSLNPARQETAAGGVPALTIALNEPHDVSVAIDTGEALTGAGIRVVLTGDIRLAGFGNQSLVSWTTDLDRGTNRLTLPVVAVKPNGGQVLVEVEHLNKRQIFVVDVGVASAAAIEQQTPADGRRPDSVNSVEPPRGSAV